METIVFISAVVICICIFVIFCNKIVKKFELPNIEWNDQNEIPTEINKDRNLSADVLVYDLDSKTLCIGFYSYSNDVWRFPQINGIENNPKNFNWAYFN